MRERKTEGGDDDTTPYHVIHKLPPGDSPYVRAKHVQLVEKNPEAAIALFWKAINEGDRVDSALKDMAVVMKQLDRAEEAIEAVSSFRDRCSKQSQESLDNVLIDLYKKCGKVEEQIQLLKRKLRMIYQGEAFNGKPTKTARSHGRKFQVTVKQETSRILVLISLHLYNPLNRSSYSNHELKQVWSGYRDTQGNLGWAYMQQGNYLSAEVVYRKAQIIEPDANKACNLCQCLIKQSRCTEARWVLEEVMQGKLQGSSDPKSRNRVLELLEELDSQQTPAPATAAGIGLSLEDAFIEGLDQLLSQWNPYRSKRLPIFEEISPFRDQLAC